ncbi:MAG: Mut7-C ubiquitin/RNAse domain-containing protein [Anaerolineales bacterium]|nr:Mut7-C ubiquitin/RNAse domain-containing protein [Anaerolineales bacterium]
MSRATFRFYAELNDFLPPARRGKAFSHAFQERAGAKDAIESLGVPHTEVDLILVNGRSVDFQHPLHDGDSVSVYPVFESLDIRPVLRLRPEPLRRPAFILDGHLGRLAAYLRLLGFDTLYRNDFADGELAERSAAEGRILLSRDRGLLKRSIVTRGYCVRSDSPRRQLREIVDRFDLARNCAPFRRCLACNGLLAPAEQQAVADGVPPGIRERFDEFYRCGGCGRIFWPGSHYARLQSILREVLEQPHA